MTRRWKALILAILVLALLNVAFSYVIFHDLLWLMRNTIPLFAPMPGVHA